MRQPCLLILYFIISITISGESYRILGIFPAAFRSHFAMYGRLMKGLAERGHQVDVVSHYPLSKPLPNYTDIVNLDGTITSYVNNFTLEFLETLQSQKSLTNQIVSFNGLNLCHLINSTALKDLIAEPPKNPGYDLVIVEILAADCYLAMGQHLKVPVVGIISSPMFPWANDIVANPDNPAYIANSLQDFGVSMNLWQRIINTLSILFSKWEFNQMTMDQNGAIKKYFGPHASTVREVEKNVSLILVNTHFSLNGVRPFTPAVIEVGGLHIDERDVIVSNDLRQWLDKCTDGFVYLSFGSLMKIESFPEETILALYASVRKLAPVRALMKITNPEELPPGLPSNVLTLSWVPQLAVLKHKNARAFVTHGGLMGIQEAIYYGVPMIGVPLFSDQGHNVMRCRELKLAVAIDRHQLTEKNLDAALNAVLNDPRYRNAAKRISAQFRDRPMSPLDTSVYWIEYVIRHGGTSLRSPAMDLTWWQIALIDVYGFLFITTFVFIYLVVIVQHKMRVKLRSNEIRSIVKNKKLE